MNRNEDLITITFIVDGKIVKKNLDNLDLQIMYSIGRHIPFNQLEGDIAEGRRYNLNRNTMDSMLEDLIGLENTRMRTPNYRTQPITLANYNILNDLTTHLRRQVIAHNNHTDENAILSRTKKLNGLSSYIMSSQNIPRNPPSYDAIPYFNSQNQRLTNGSIECFPITPDYSENETITTYIEVPKREIEQLTEVHDFLSQYDPEQKVSNFVLELQNNLNDTLEIMFTIGKDDKAVEKIKNSIFILNQMPNATIAEAMQIIVEESDKRHHTITLEPSSSDENDLSHDRNHWRGLAEGRSFSRRSSSSSDDQSFHTAPSSPSRGSPIFF